MSNGVSEFTEAELAALKRAPLYVLKAVAGADSFIDHEEWAALLDAVVDARTGGDGIVGAVMGPLAQELHGGPVDLSDGRGPIEGLAEVRTILEKLPGDAGLHFRETLLEIAATIAESSGAQLTRTFTAHNGEARWARSAGTSAQEREAIESVAAALGLD